MFCMINQPINSIALCKTWILPLEQMPGFYCPFYTSFSFPHLEGDANKMVPLCCRHLGQGVGACACRYKYQFPRTVSAHTRIFFHFWWNRANHSFKLLWTKYILHENVRRKIRGSPESSCIAWLWLRPIFDHLSVECDVLFCLFQEATTF